LNYPSIRIEGAILSPDILDRIEELPGQKPADFGLESSARVKDEIVRAWADAQDYWRIFQRKLEALKQDSPATTETRQQWVVPLLGLLGYQLEYQARGVELNGKSYAISHRAANRAQAPVHIVGYREPAGLDRKPERSNVRMSAHAVVQELINLNEQLYGIITNGRVLRLLRDSSRLIKQSYLEFDLDRIFTDGLFADFAILFRLLHATRLPATTEGESESLIERYHQDSLDSGARIREGLSKAVEDAILTFGNGFLAHPANAQLRERFTRGQLSADEYYTSLLRLIYRLLFLMVIEERGLVFPPAATQRQRETYARFYSVQRLRNLSEKRYLADRRQSDLWLALRATFRLFEGDGLGAKLGLKPLAGDLFRSDAIGTLADAQLGNDALLACLRSLTLYEHPENKQLIRVNYAALNVEEFGSVYEGLLEYEPTVDGTTTPPVFGFKQGDLRSATGSHYTPDDLVQPLIKHSLDYLIAERLKTPSPEAALLDLRVADIACGSGHILLAAARRIATELAVVRTGEEQPSPSAYRVALRDTVRSCIFGVDLNPLAVELCKVALWLEAHNPGEPLNFLDHHIKCGNAIVGAARREEIDGGVADEAFAKIPGDDADICKAIRARNRRERKDRSQGTLVFTQARQGEIAAVLDRWKAITAMLERSPSEIDAKKQAFESFTSSGSAWLLKQIASIPIAQFYLPRTRGNEAKLITDAEFRQYWLGSAAPQGQGPEAAFGLARRKRLFHWFFEFPEIMQRGGFDCILGNPPYLGGQALSSTYGHEFCEYVRHAYAPTGLSDLVAYFVRRIFKLLRPGGYTAFITTNSIRDGDVRKDGLEQVMAQGGKIAMAVRGVKWPGRANLVVSLVVIRHGALAMKPVLDGRVVDTISAYLEDAEPEVEPLALRECESVMFNGSNVLGDGFFISETEAHELLAKDERYRDVVFTVMNGQELNSEPTLVPSRWIINFRERHLEEAKSYPLALELVEQRGRAARETIPRDTAINRHYHDHWWQYGILIAQLYRKLDVLSHSFVLAATTKYLSIARLPARAVYTHALRVLTTDRWDIFAVVQSTLHEVWARKYCGALETRLRYSPKACFETFAFPHDLWHTSSPVLAAIGERYHEQRRVLMLSLWLGLTDVYNLFHSRELEADLKKTFASRAKKDPKSLNVPAEHRARVLAFSYELALAGVRELRKLHVELDTAVLAAYGWHQPGVEGPAIDLGHDFHDVETLPEDDRTRFTISSAGRRESLRRLLALNYQRAKQPIPEAELDRQTRLPRSTEQSEHAKTAPLFPEQP
jgi:methylase of polypeptide subunit release factors